MNGDMRTPRTTQEPLWSRLLDDVKPDPACDFQLNPVLHGGNTHDALFPILSHTPTHSMGAGSSKPEASAGSKHVFSGYVLPCRDNLLEGYCLAQLNLSTMTDAPY